MSRVITKKKIDTSFDIPVDQLLKQVEQHQKWRKANKQRLENARKIKQETQVQKPVKKQQTPAKTVSVRPSRIQSRTISARPSRL